MNHPQQLSRTERLARVEARLRVMSELMEGGTYDSVSLTDVWPGLHDELQELAGELGDLITTPPSDPPPRK